MRVFLKPIVLSTLLVLLSFPVHSWANTPAMQQLIGKVARQEGVDPNLLLAMVAIESRFDAVSVSKRGAVGLMQLMPGTARDLGVRNRFNPEQNLRGGARYIRKMMDMFSNDLTLALAAYNAGPANVQRFKGIPPFSETRNYIQKVLKHYAKKVPGRDQPPKKIYHFRKPNGTLVLADSRRIFTLFNETESKSSKSVSVPKPAKPYVSIRHTGHDYQSETVGGYAEEIPVIRLSRR